MKNVVADVMAARGVPTTIGEAHDLAGALYPQIMGERRVMWAREGALIGDEHPDLVVPEIAMYPQTATEKMVRRSAGLTPDSQGVQLELFDPATVEMVRTSVAPYTTPDEPAVVEAFAQRVATGAARHIKAASRDLVVDTARVNRTRWARRLQGGENCPFCAMLASRGAVYSEKGVRFQSHAHCDCTAELVRDVGSWDGKEESDSLSRLWNRSKSLADFGHKFREMMGYAVPA